MDRSSFVTEIHAELGLPPLDRPRTGQTQAPRLAATRPTLPEAGGGTPQLTSLPRSYQWRGEVVMGALGSGMGWVAGARSGKRHEWRHQHASGHTPVIAPNLAGEKFSRCSHETSSRAQGVEEMAMTELEAGALEHPVCGCPTVARNLESSLRRRVVVPGRGIPGTGCNRRGGR